MVHICMCVYVHAWACEMEREGLGWGSEEVGGGGGEGNWWELAGMNAEGLILMGLKWLASYVYLYETVNQGRSWGFWKNRREQWWQASESATCQYPNVQDKSGTDNSDLSIVNRCLTWKAEVQTSTHCFWHMMNKHENSAGVWMEEGGGERSPV